MQHPMVDMLRSELVHARVRYFKAEELLRIRHKHLAERAGITTPLFVPASRAIVLNLVDVAKVADQLRERFGRPIRVRNGLRPRAYNNLVSKAKHSQHIFGRALDLVVDRKLMPELREIAVDMWKAEAFHGIGLYADPPGDDGEAAMHVDTRIRARRKAWGKLADRYIES